MLAVLTHPNHLTLLVHRDEFVSRLAAMPMLWIMRGVLTP
ncbi:hypothetical protein yrohd0001_6390 [Yersinia rohdei ATCC 43380]|nr:hypothetical protein yrohd0001_6390 [Yersinia rohdei ATCC 43380]